MEVVHVYDGHEKVHEGRGSVPDVVWQLARRVAARGNDVTVVERRWNGLPRTAEHDGVEFRRLDLRTGTAEPWEQIPYRMVSTPRGALTLLLDRTNFARAARRVVAGADPDVVHVHLPFAANVLAAFAPGLRDRLVYTAHLGEIESRVVDPTFSPDVYLAKRAARTVALNPRIEEAFAARGVPEEKLTVIPNGVDRGQFDDVTAVDRERVAAEYGLPGDSVLVLFVGTVTPRKGVLELVRAASHLDRSAHVVVVGRTDLEPDYVSKVRAAVGTRNLEDRVTFTGFVPETDLHAIYDLADVFTLPSYEEGSSISVMEAIAAGLPVVGSRIDGITQQVEDGVHGVLVDPGDVDGLAAGLTRVVDNDETREAMREAMTRRADELSWERVADRTIRMYEEVTGA